MAILVENLQNKIEIDEAIIEKINKAVELSFKLENFTIPSEVSILLVDNERIREMNQEYRNIDNHTDVLSFPMVEMKEGEILSDEGDFDMDENLLILGDIVVSMEMVQEQAQKYEHSFERELAFLVTHGVFHLLGYDHEEESDEQKMMSKQESVLEQMELRRI